ncbi:uncharacterized protein A1O5_09612 [Cladophialophora psammophila CBS 110553]|uniref:Xylanolytic transcriptional activator regulatory domain-containing protein n=1 Tax=Cladophialophora psammophila CBS 110553 TaxID=1182543 RepID=W9WQN9_9EURO|nr:uncharacterized protein A1O5_09612 [Cladophialophora psammophila CBS 110553]EXJ66966.1 hypothetical protein A1O5_09612 [Cladophialophora psammophila CBS 110553]
MLIRLPTPDTAISISADYKQVLSVNVALWALLLNEIGAKVSQILRRPSDDRGPSVLFGPAKTVSRSEIISQLPSRYSCDTMVARFFSHLYPAMHILHEPTFCKQIDQSTTPPAWAALLFAMLRVAMLDYLRENDEPLEFRGKCQDLATNFLNRFTDCLILVDYTQTQDFLVETLCFHLYGEYVASRDSKSSIWVLVGMIVRLAMRMGYHQPLQPTLTHTPFQAEMRRLVWAFIRQYDIFLSFQLGLPSMIRIRSLEGPQDLPRNIHDDEYFGEDCTTLPPALSDSEPTQISYLIAESKLAFGFTRALEEMNRSATIPCERVLEIDRELRRIYDSAPDHYKLGLLSVQDSLVLVSARFVLSSIHHISLCIVHSRFLEIAKSDSRFVYSRRLRSLANYQTSLTIHHYLLAAAIIAADLCSSSAVDDPISQQLSSGVPTRTEMIKGLGLSAWIFSQMGDQRMEAYKAADVLQMLVKKFEAEARNCSAQDLQPIPTGQSMSLTKSNALGSNPICPHHTSSPGVLAAASDRPSSFTRASSDIRHGKRLLQGFSCLPQGRPDPLAEGSHLEVLSAIPEDPETSFCATSPLGPQMFQHLEASSWAIPAYPEEHYVKNYELAIILRFDGFA